MLWIGLGILVFLAAAVLLTCYICYRLTFYVPPRDREKAWQEDVGLPVGEVYEPHWGVMRRWMEEARQMPYETLTIQSFDGLTLYARYYEYAPGAPIELMFHGYRGRAERDLSGGIQRSFALGHSAVLVDQRAAGRSEGKTITFGACEQRDCHEWVACLRRRFGEDVRIILTGISMGAATVLLAAGSPLPPQVIGVLADCGYTDGGEMICKTIKDLKLPPRLLYPFVKWGARLFGHFRLEDASPIRTVGICKVPMVFIHGETDVFVPCEMSRRNYEAATAEKRLLTVPGAGHGLSYIIEPDKYVQVLREMFPCE